MPFNAGSPRTYTVIVQSSYPLCCQIDIMMDYFKTCILMNFLILPLAMNGTITGYLQTFIEVIMR